MKKLEKRQRKYFPDDFDPTDWNQVETALKGLLESELNEPSDLVALVEKATELGDILEEEAAWRYIRMTCNVDKKEYAEAFNRFYSEVLARAQPYEFQLKKKIYESPLKTELPEDYQHMLKIVSNDIELFREENIPLQVKERELSNQYGAIVGNITVDFDGERKTLQQLLVYLKEPDRDLRERAWRKRYEGIWSKREELNHLFDELKELRIQQAKNAGFDNYRDYMHRLKGRFEYTPQDLFEFHEAVEKEVIPFLKERIERRKKKLGIDSVRPWDTSVDVDGRVLKPFKTIDEFVEKAIKILKKVHPLFGERLELMKNSGLLDLENRKGKAPGGYNYPLLETGAPFIFMNAVGQSADVRTILHESGHAMHTFETVNIPISFYRPNRMEIAELASMSMELLTLDHWNEFYKDEEDFKKAKIEELENAVFFLPWCMTVDAFQHWIYTNPNHTPKERDEYFAYLMERFNPGVDWINLDAEKMTRWMFQLHIFEVPFYYIEYGIAQLGALAIYKRYLEDPGKAVEDYIEFLKTGYSLPLDKVYEKAGIKLDFSRDYVRSIVEFVSEELRKIEG